MGITGLGTYSSTSFYYAMSNRSKNSNVGNESAFGFLSETDREQTNMATTSNKTDVAITKTAYSKWNIASIRTDELSSEKIAEEKEPEEVVTPLGFGFANAGMMGYGMSAADLIKMLKESHKITAKELKEETDWRDFSDEEWDKMLEGLDKYIDAYKERLKQMKEMQEESAQKAAAEADPGMKTLAAAEAALAAAANGFSDGTVSDGENAETGMSMGDEEEYEKNWTKKMKTDDQTILMTAKEAQKMEKMAGRKIEDIANDTEYSSYEYVSVVDKIEQKEKDAESKKEPLRLIAMDRNGIRLINDETHEYEWEIKFSSEEEYSMA